MTTGLSQAYGIFQAYHARAVGCNCPLMMMPDEDAQHRSLIGLVGSLGGDGLSKLMGPAMVWYMVGPVHRFRGLQWSRVSILALVGTTLMATGHFAASFTDVVSVWRTVSRHFKLICPAMETLPHSRSDGWRWRWVIVVSCRDHSCGVLSTTSKRFDDWHCSFR